MGSMNRALKQLLSGGQPLGKREPAAKDLFGSAPHV